MSIQNEIKQDFGDVIKNEIIRISKQKPIWNDLHLGDLQLFGIDQLFFDKALWKYIHNDVKHIIKSNQWIGLVAHDTKTLEYYKNTFDVRHIIKINNNDNLVKLRGFKFKPMSEIKDDNQIIWDSEWFEDSSIYLDKFNQIYNTIGLTGFSEEYITRYIETWKKFR